MSGSEPDARDIVTCRHCLREVPRHAAVAIETDGVTAYFCCHGCLGVYELIHNASLETFYSHRKAWQPGTPSFGTNDAESFTASVVKTSGGSLRIELQLSGIRCASCIWLIEQYLSKMPGVLSARVNYASNRAAIDWQPERCSLTQILDALNSPGYTALPLRNSFRNESLLREKQDQLLRFGTACFFFMQLMLVTAALYAGFFQGIGSAYRLPFQLISWALATPVLFYSGYPFLSGAVRSLRMLNPNMDLLVALGSLSAYLYSIAMIALGGEVFFDTSAMIVTIVLLGRMLEAGSRLKAGNAVAALAELQPQHAVRLSENGERESVRIEQVRPGERIEIRPGEKIPLDGTVIEGESETIEAMLTGESRPVMKTSGSTIFAGTLNSNGRLVARVTGGVRESLLAGIVRAVEEAQSRKAPVQQLADRISGHFVPFILLIAAGTFLYWMHVSGSSLSALMNAVSVLVIACPCALGLATPLAILSGTTAAGRQGMLIKGGDVLETLSKTTTVAFDKTGTITRGNPSVTDFKEFGSQSATLQHAASMESLSEHPAGKAVAAHWKGSLLNVEKFQAIAGEGVSGIIGEKPWLAGSAALMKKKHIPLSREQAADVSRLESEGKAVVLVACGTDITGLFGLNDEIREEIPQLLSALRKRNLRLMMLTGDNRGVAARIAARCGISDTHAELSPHGKTGILEKRKAEGACVMMVGDGVNDAPALTEADSGVTLGSASGIAVESADVVILNDDIRTIETLLKHAKQCFSVIRQNLVWAFLYNAAAIPLAAAGVLHPIVAAAFMASSSLIVVGNSLRLQKTGSRKWTVSTTSSL